MDVRCERCRAQYAVDDARVSEVGVKVACAQCGHAFLLRKKTLAVTVPLKGTDTETPIPIGDLASPGGAPEPRGAGGAERGEWRLRQPGGAIFPFRELSTLQRWVVERKASREDEVAAAGEGDAWRRLGDIPELQSFFALLEKAQRRREPEGPPGPQPAPSRSRSGLEDPAWASGPVPPTRRVTRSALRPPPPRRRVVWVALLALGLLGVAAGMVYLRWKADAEATKAALSEEMAQAPVAVPSPAAVAPPPPAPEPAPKPPSEAPPEPAPAVAEATAAPPSGGAPPPAEGSPAVAAQPVPVQANPAVPEPQPPAARPPPRDEAPGPLRALLARAREERDRGRCEAALDLYGQALSLEGGNASALAGRGACYLDLSRYAQAEASFEGALESDPRNAEALHGMAETYRYMGRNADAVIFYERFLAVRPTGDDAAAARRLISQLKE